MSTQILCRHICFRFNLLWSKSNDSDIAAFLVCYNYIDDRLVLVYMNEIVKYLFVFIGIKILIFVHSVIIVYDILVFLSFILLMCFVYIACGFTSKT